MELLDTEEKMMNAQWDSAEDMAEMYYFFFNQNYVSDELFKHLEEWMKKFGITDDEFIQMVESYGNSFDRKVDNFENKLMNTTYIRKETKVIFKHVEKEISQTRLKKLIATSLGLTVAKISNMYYQMCFSNEVMEQLIDLVSQEELLKNEFEQVIIRSVKDIPIHVVDENYDLEYCFTHMLAQFFCDYYFYEGKQCESLKKEIQSLISIPKNAIRKKAEQLQQKYTDIHEQYKKEIHQSIKYELEDIYPDITHDTGMNINENTEHYIPPIFAESEVLDDEEIASLKFAIKKAREIYKKYFEYEEDEEFEDKCIDRVLHAYFECKKESNGMVQKCAGYLNECFQNYAENCFDENDDNHQIHRNFIVSDFFLFLAHHLLNGSNDYKKEFLDMCHDLLNKNLVVANHYTNIMNDFRLIPHCLNYTPNQFYECVVVISILEGMENDKSIMKKVKRLLLKYYKDINDDLAKQNKKEYQRYFEENSEEYQNDILHECAVTFIFNYLKDPIYLAPLSVLIFEFEDVINEHQDFYLHDNSIVDSIGQKDKINQNQFLQKAYDYYQDISEIINQFHEIDTEQVEAYIYAKYTSLFISATQRDFVFDDFYDGHYMLTQNQKYLAYILGLDYKSISHQYEELSQVEKIKFLWDLAIQISLIKEIYISKKYIPQVQDLSKDEYTRSLEKTLEDAKAQIQDAKSQNRLLKNQLSSVNDILKKKDNDKNMELNKAYNREIHDLNKQLVQKDKEIQELKEKEQELYKLRELMFHLQNEDENNDENAIDYTQELSSITQREKIICVGGHIKLLSSLKQKYPDIIFVNNRNSISRQMIESADYIFFFYNFLNHGLYYKIMGILNSTANTKWDYISSKNLSLVERDMYMKITDSEK